MTLETFYNEIGSDYKSVLLRMGNSEKILGKFTRKFANDKTTNELITAFESGDFGNAFRMAHTLKGVCANLGFDKLRESSSALTESLRDGASPDSADLLEQVKKDYAVIIDALAQLDDAV